MALELLKLFEGFPERVLNLIFRILHMPQNRPGDSMAAGLMPSHQFAKRQDISGLGYEYQIRITRTCGTVLHQTGFSGIEWSPLHH